MFGEKDKEYSRIWKKQVPVFQLPKYKESKKVAEEIIKKYDNITEGDFWILINESKNDEKVFYSGLIISHNGCLKLNDTLDSKFDPECVEVDKQGYKNSLVFSYCNKEQGIYEVGEVSADNCKNAYPYAMAYKRCFDRVVLKLSKLAYGGVYSDSEADEFKEREPEADEVIVLASEKDRKTFMSKCEQLEVAPTEILGKVGWTGGKMTTEHFAKAMIILSEIEEAK